MIVLDTNVISALMQSKSETVIVDWLNDQPSESIWTTSVCVFEVLYGIRCLAKGKRQHALQRAFDESLLEDLDGRVLDFDVAAAKEAAGIASALKATGRPVEIRDVQIAGIVLARHGTLATRNIRHFADTGIALVNPWDVDS